MSQAKRQTVKVDTTLKVRLFGPPPATPVLDDVKQPNGDEDPRPPRVRPRTTVDRRVSRTGPVPSNCSTKEF